MSLSQAKDLVKTLADARLVGYGATLPGPLDAAFRALAALYAGSDASGRAAIRALVPADLSLLLLGFSDRMAIIAARTKDEGALFDALLAHVLEGFRYDPRENVFRLAVVHHVANKIGLDPRAEFERAASMASPEAARELRAFLARPDELKTLKAMRVREIETPEGVSFAYE
jgi:hypothetical protein